MMDATENPHRHHTRAKRRIREKHMRIEECRNNRAACMLLIIIAAPNYCCLVYILHSIGNAMFRNVR